MDKSYWEKYYKKKKRGDHPTPTLFAQFVGGKFIDKNGTLIELGCGDGRDSIFFAEKGLIVTAVDQCSEAMILLNESHTHERLRFVANDFTRLPNNGSYDYVYSRFTMHCIRSNEEDAVLDWMKRNSKAGSRFFVEVRGKKNELFGLGVSFEGEPDAFIYEDHFRRFIDIDIFLDKITKRGFKILYAKEQKGFAPFKDTDYTFIRIVAEKTHE